MQVTVSDGEMEDVGQLILEITDENEAPVFGRDSYNVYGNEGKVCYHFSESAMRQRILSFLTEKSCICLSKADLYNMLCLNRFFHLIYYNKDTILFSM